MEDCVGKAKQIKVTNYGRSGAIRVKGKHLVTLLIGLMFIMGIWWGLRGRLSLIADGQTKTLPTKQVTPIFLPISERNFFTGTTPTVDQTENPASAYILSKEIGKVFMLWVTPNGIGLYDKLCKVNPVANKTNYQVVCDIGLIPVVNLNSWTVKPGKGIVRNDGYASRDFADPEFVRRMCEEAYRIAARFKPMYFSIDNEVNTVYEWLGEKTFNGLVSLERKLYDAVKEVSPKTKVIVVISYNQLVDLPAPPRFHLIEKLAGAYDVLGVTTYPWRKYATPQDLPDDYYRRLSKYTDKPIAFTEIGWSSDTAQGGSEDEQVEYLLRFLEITKGMQLEFVNWAFLHDLPESSVTGFVGQRTHLGLGLRRYDGSSKKVWAYFQALSQLKGP